MKKNLILTSIVATVIIACTKGEGGNTAPNPSPPHKPSITINSIDPSTSTLIYDGSQNPKVRATISFTVGGNTSPITVTGGNLNGDIITTDTLLTNVSVRIDATNATGTTTVSVPITVTISPLGNMLSKKWENTFREYKSPIDVTWQPWNIPANEVGNILVIKPYGIWDLWQNISMTQKLQHGSWYLSGTTVTDCGFPKTTTGLTDSSWDTYYTDGAGNQYHFRYERR
jgi:hypothetical protein